MNPDTGELRNITHDSPKTIEKLIKKGFKKLPKKLNHAAKCKLKGKKKAKVSLTSGGKLSKWAAKERKRRKMVDNCNEYYNNLRRNNEN